MTAVIEEKLNPATRAAIAGMGKGELLEFADIMTEEACHVRALAESLDSGEMYLPGLELPVPLPPELLN